MPRHAFIIGGTGQIGRAVASELLDRGWTVTLSSRGMRPGAAGLVARGARMVVLDREEPGALVTALSGGADAVIDTVAYGKAHADQLLEAESDVGAFVVISSSSVYRDYAGRTLDEAAKGGFPDFPAPIRETQPTVEPGPQTYSTSKVALERRLLEGATRPVIVLRPGAIHGPYSTHPREWWFVKRMLDRRPVIPLTHRGQSRFHTTAVANIARLTGIVVDRPQTHILNIADPVAHTVFEIGGLIAGHLGYAGRILPIGLPEHVADASIGWSPWSVPAPFTLDTEAATALGYQAAARYEDCVAATCNWLVSESNGDWKKAFPILAAYPNDAFDYLAEDAFLSGRAA
ncbi:NAD-dependent epimerase/dehydratase family protein [Rhizobium sp. 18055]|jgi:nucleoside-diphosphate-sugar epimerase|uniref:NAD-dependent epimerase/dehydratase family protein n=1 Tax=Rhizobium sp. 18055 TaxID=2681403 RepID=UPI001359ABF7|nr:NAD-dependent epimerase/dehydratase family protein [Rhizobium sp. 18055]